MKEIKYYCQFHKSTGNHYSSICSRNPANLRNSSNAEEDNRRKSSSSNKKPTSSKHPLPKHPGKPEASKYQRKMKRLFSSSEDENEDTPVITLEEEEQKEIDALGNDTEDEATKTTKVKDIEEEKNEDTLPRLSPSYTFENNDLPSLSENEECSSDVDKKEPAQTSKIVTKNEWMKQKIKTLEREVKIQEMQNQIIKYEISNVNSIQDIRQLKKKHKINLN